MALYQDFGSQIANVIQQASATIIQAYQFQQRLQLEREEMQTQKTRQNEVFKMQQEKLKLEQEMFQLDKSKQARLQQEANVATARAGMEMGRLEMEAYEREAARRDGSDPDFIGYTTMKELADYISKSENSLSAERSRSFGETVNTPEYQARQAAVDRAKLEQRNRAGWLKTNRPPTKTAAAPIEDELTRLATGGGTTKAQAVSPAAVGDPSSIAANVESYGAKGDFTAIFNDLDAAARRGPDQVNALFAAYANIFPGGREGLARMIRDTRKKAK